MRAAHRDGQPEGSATLDLLAFGRELELAGSRALGFREHELERARCGTLVEARAGFGIDEGLQYMMG